MQKGSIHLNTSTTSSSGYTLQKIIVIALLLAVYRLFVLMHSDVDMFADETYYWGWAQHFDFGYYSKPPMVAWMIMITTSLCGDGQVCIKLGSIIAYFFTTLSLYFLGKELYDEKVGFFSALAFATIPAVFLSSTIISTDAPFLLFWSLSLNFFVRAIRRDTALLWVLTGIAAGLGMMSKYTMILFLISAVIFLVLSPKYRYHLTNLRFYAAIAITTVIFLPNLVWNMNNHFASFQHTEDLASPGGFELQIGKMFEFVGAQFGVFGPIFFGVFLLLLFTYRSKSKEEAFKLLWWFIVPLFALIVSISVTAGAYANWAAPIYVPATVLVIAYLIQNERMRLLKAGLIINIVFGLLIYHYHDISDAIGIERTAKTDPYKRVMGWSALGTEVTKVMKAYPGVKLLGDDRKDVAQLIYYVEPHPFDIQYWNPDHSISDQYDLMKDLSTEVGKDLILITHYPDREQITKYFEKSEQLDDIVIDVYSDYSLHYYVYYLHDFKGYE